ncbi:MAG TPA: TolC family protein [Methylophilaceae bacterium]|nr:TolC family protein [Methylophilaceae bacterium]
MRLYHLLFISLMWLATAHAADVAYRTVSTTEPATTLTLATAIQLALEANPEISVARREREAVAGAKVQAAIRPNPSVSAFMEDTRDATRQTTIQLNQPFELGGKRAARIEAADVRYEAADAAIAAKQAEIRATVIAAFYDVLVAQERAALAESSLQLAQRASDAASKRVLAGKISPVEETKAKVAESAVRIERNQAQSQLATARKRLTALWGNPAPRFSEVAGEVDRLPAIAGLAHLSAMLPSSPVVRRARLEVEQRLALARLEETKRTPDLTVSMGARRNEELGLNQAILGVSIPIPVFDRNQGNLQEALSRTDKARDELAALQLQQATQLDAAYERYEAARQEVELIRSDILPGAQRAYDAAAKGFEYGKFGFLDVLDAQRTFFLARSQYLNATLRGHQAYADIERLVGDIDHAAPIQQSAEQSTQPDATNAAEQPTTMQPAAVQPKE